MPDTKSIALPACAKDLTGHPPFGRWTVLSYAGSRDGNAYWICQCDCGTTKEVCGGSLNRGDTRSCGCLQREQLLARSTTHGKTRSPEYHSWNHMLRRCYNQRDWKYPQYGGRGIAVCERWQDSFEAFYEDMGDKPSAQHSIEREDNDGNYEPGNCVWATPNQQARNRRSSRMLAFGGRTQCISDWAEELGMSRDTIRKRLNAGWSVERALTETVSHRATNSSAAPWL